MKYALLLLIGLLPINALGQSNDDQPLTGIKLPADFATFAEKQNEGNRSRADKIKTQIDNFGMIVDSVGSLIPTNVPKSYCSAEDSSYDARSKNLVTPVRDQGAVCQACWAFVTAELLESAEMAQAGRSPTLSAQQVLSCSVYGTCAGGQGIPVGWLTQNGLVTDASLPYDPHNHNVACQTLKASVHTKSAGFLRDKGDLPSSLEEREHFLKQGLCDHGTLGVFMSATNGLLKVGKSVYLNDQPEGSPEAEVNHLVELIGWDDASHAWIVKNSYGSGVGDQGYFKIAYASRWFGYGALWIEALDEPFLLMKNSQIKLKPDFSRATKAQRP